MLITELLLTGHDVSQPNGCHGDEAEVEGLEERPVLPHCEQGAPHWYVHQERRHPAEGHQPSLARLRAGLAAKLEEKAGVVYTNIG